MVEGENQLLQVVFWPACAAVCTHPHNAHTINTKGFCVDSLKVFILHMNRMNLGEIIIFSV